MDLDRAALSVIMSKVLQILLVEDNPADVRLVREVLKTSQVPLQMSVVRDGVEALQFLNNPDCPRPDLTLLDINLPKVNGHQVLEAIKQDPCLKAIPVMMFSSSDAVEDVSRAYEKNANCYVKKPKNLDEFLRVMAAIESFWFEIVSLPPHSAIG